MIVEELAPVAEGADDLERLHSLGRRLIELDPERLARVVSLAAAYVSIYERPGESDDAFAARLRLLDGRGTGGKLT